MDKNTKKEYKLKKLKYGYRKKSFDNLVVKRVKFDGKLTNKQQDLEILNAKEEYIKNNREMYHTSLPEKEVEKITIKSAVAGGILSAGVVAGALSTGIIEPDEVLAVKDMVTIASATGVVGSVFSAGIGKLFLSDNEVLHFVENKKLSANALKQRIATKQIENYETKIQALDETIKGKYEKVSDLVHDERYEELDNIKRERNMSAVAAYFRDRYDEGIDFSNEEKVKDETSLTNSTTSELPKLNVRPYDPALDGVDPVATIEELNDMSDNGYEKGCIFESDNDFEA